MHLRVLIHRLRAGGAIAIAMASLACASDAGGPDRSQGFSSLVALSAARLELSRQVCAVSSRQDGARNGYARRGTFDPAATTFRKAAVGSADNDCAPLIVLAGHWTR